MKNIRLVIILISLSATFIACKKEAGDGGNSSITGKVHITKYNAFWQNPPTGNYPGADEDVFIIYGDEITIGDRINTDPDGRFEFKYLRKGNYKIYVYTGDTTNSDTIGKVAVYKNVEITKKKQTVDCGTFEIKKN